MKIIITGVTGMVGEGVFHEALADKSVSEILIIGRKPYNFPHPKVKEIVHENMYNFSSIKDKIRGYDACFFCLGTTSIGKKEPEFTKITYDLTLAFAKVFAEVNPNATFIYVSGGGTDSTEKGKTMWARVKGKTENDLMKLPFKQAFMFRPGYLHPTEGMKNTNKYYKYITWLYPVFKVIFPNSVSTLHNLGLAMLFVTKNGYEKQILEVKDINLVAKQA